MQGYIIDRLLKAGLLMKNDRKYPAVYSVLLMTVLDLLMIAPIQLQCVCAILFYQILCMPKMHAWYSVHPHGSLLGLFHLKSSGGGLENFADPRPHILFKGGKGGMGGKIGNGQNLRDSGYVR